MGQRLGTGTPVIFVFLAKPSPVTRGSVSLSREGPNDAEPTIFPPSANGLRATFTVRQEGRVAGMTSVLFDPGDPAGAEVGGTQLDPGVWGTGVNTEVKRLLFEVIFPHGAEWIQLRTDERNGRSAAAIRKLGAADLGVHQDHRVRRDGTRRRSPIFRQVIGGTLGTRIAAWWRCRLVSAGRRRAGRGTVAAGWLGSSARRGR